MKRFFFLLSLVIVTLSSCSTMDPVSSKSKLPYEVISLAQNNMGDSVLMIETEKYHYVVEKGTIIRKYDVTTGWVEAGALIFAIFLAMLFGLFLGSITI